MTVAIGTEGAAPVLARKIKSDIEEMPASLGILARVGKAFRPMSESAAFGAARREFWARYFLIKVSCSVRRRMGSRSRLEFAALRNGK